MSFAHVGRYETLSNVYARSMEFTDEEIATLIEAWAADSGERLTPEVARVELKRVLEFFTMIMRHFHSGTSEQSDAVAERDTMPT